MRTETGNQDIILAATNALLNALEFVSENFKNQVIFSSIIRCLWQIVYD